MTKIGTLAIHPITLHDCAFLGRDAISQKIFKMFKRDDGLRFPPIVKIVTDGIVEGLTLHDVVPTSASWGPSQVVVSYKSCSVRPALRTAHIEMGLRPPGRLE